MQVFAALFQDRSSGQENAPELVFAATEADLLQKVKDSLKANVEGFQEMMGLDDAEIDSFASLDDINEFLCELPNDPDYVHGELFIHTYEVTL